MAPLTLANVPRRNYYDVFVTFRGEDTRNNFTDHLFDALQRKGIITFRDDTNLQKGEYIAPELLRAIEVSQIFIVVFSKNYASSTWCLQELEKICQYILEKSVLPVFYDVDPSEVRHQKGTYGDALVKHEQRYQQDSKMVQRWRDALTHVANLSGWDVRHAPQSVEIKKIVQKIINILGCKSSCVPKDLVGIDSPIEELEKLLLLDSADDVRVVGICGMGGIGKTSLATVLYEKISHKFGACCFIDDVSKIYRLHDGPLGVQKQILHQTLDEEHHEICNHYNATNLIRSRLGRERALLILDNVDQVEQLEKVDVRREWLGAGSRIIIISRDEHILKEYAVDLVYKVHLLNEADALRLLCRKAFKLDNIITSNYEKLAYDVLKYANGLPLAIKVLGSFLCGRDISEWRSALARWKESPDKDVMDVLQISFDGLKETEKEIFLHIACFFNSCLEKYVKNVLNCCGFHADIGLRVLIDKSLINIKDKTIEMHALLKELGRKIAQENSCKELRKWGRMWFKKQLYDVMLQNMEKHVEAIVFNHEFELLEDAENMDQVIVDNFSKMSHLRLLIIKYIMNVSGSLSCLSNELRYVEWFVYPFTYLPSSFQPNQLVELILKHSNIKQLWEDKKYLPNLRTLDLRHSKKLIKISDFGDFPSLERLNLKGCVNLVQIDASIGLLRNLVSLNLKNCINLKSIPNSIFGLTSLKDLNMSWCSKVFNNSRHLNISESAWHFQSTSSIFKWTTSPSNSSSPTPSPQVDVLPSLLNLYCLREVSISFCGISHIPDAIGCLRWIEILDLGGNNFVTLPSLKELTKLVYLNLQHCKLMESLPQLPFSTTIEQNFGMTNFQRRIGLFIFNCPKLGEREHFSSMAFSWMRQLIQANPESSSVLFDVINIVTPGSEVPSWFNNQSVGSSISIDPSTSMNDKDNNIIGFACCIVFSMAPHYSTMIRSSSKRPHAEMTLGFANIHGYVPINKLSVIFDEDLITVKSNHIWLIYFPRESSYDISNENIRVEIVRGEGLGVEVKNCGYRWVYKQDLEEFNLTMMHPKNSLAQKRKILASEDEIQPQRHSFI